MRARKSILTDFQGCEALPPLISLTVRDAVLISGICRSKLYELIQQGILPIRKIGRTTLVPYDALSALVGNSNDAHGNIVAPTPTIATRVGVLSSDSSALKLKTKRSDNVASSRSRPLPSDGLRHPITSGIQENFFDLLSDPNPKRPTSDCDGQLLATKNHKGI